MGKHKKSRQEDLAIEYSDKIEDIYKKFGATIEVNNWSFHKDRIQYQVKTKRRTKIADVKSLENEVQARLKLPLFLVQSDGLDTSLTIAVEDIEYPSLMETINKDKMKRAMGDKELPYIVGHNIMGDSVVVDLASFPHLLLGGSSGFGKSVGLQSLITSIAHSKSPTDVNFILIDVGASDLTQFENIPHLSCPIIQDHETAYNALIALKAEMERRIKLEHTSQHIAFVDTQYEDLNFERLPRLVLVIDEFPALFSNLPKEKEKSLIGTISSLLQRGRHGKIHIVIAAQNPTIHAMKVDLGNISARIAFRCAKENYSITILGEKGAENLVGKGSLLLKSPQQAALEWIQGSYISTIDIENVTSYIKQWSFNGKLKYNLTISETISQESSNNSQNHLPSVVVEDCPSEEDRLIASVIFWSFSRNLISTNKVMNEFKMGWNKASFLVNQLEKSGIINQLNGKKSRYVKPESIEDVHEDIIKFMEYCDYPRDSLISAFQERSKKDR